MARKLDKLIVIDIEATCWENTPIRQTNEIIEIGLCVINLEDLSIDNLRSIFVKNQHSEINEYCTNLTTITQEQIDEKGILFSEACAILRKEYKSANRTWASWGDYDRRQFERQCADKEKHKARYPFGATHLNLKNLFALQQGLVHEAGMEKALGILDMPLVGTHHRGVDDAFNIANIAIHMFLKYRVV